MEKSLSEKFRAAEVELVYRSKVRAADRPKVRAPEEAYAVLMEHWDAGKIGLVEQFNVLMVNHAKACLGIAQVSTGSTSSCLVDPKVIFATALKANASGLILAHNHPSGNLRPSDADVQLTRRLAEGGRLLDVEVLDHLVVTPEGFASLRALGLMTGCSSPPAPRGR